MAPATTTRPVADVRFVPNTCNPLELRLGATGARAENGDRASPSRSGAGMSPIFAEIIPRYYGVTLGLLPVVENFCRPGHTVCEVTAFCLTKTRF